jgi:predicted ArsR family transcriptional regulator
MAHDDLRWGTKAMDVLAYTCEFADTIVANDIAFHLGTSVDAIRVQISRLRKAGLVGQGSPYKATEKGRSLYESALRAEGIR